MFLLTVKYFLNVGDSKKRSGHLVAKALNLTIEINDMHRFPIYTYHFFRLLNKLGNTVPATPPPATLEYFEAPQWSAKYFTNLRKLDFFSSFHLE